MNRIKQELLAKVIRNKREKLELSQSQLASAAHINRAMISKIENGTYMPSIAQLEDLQEVLYGTEDAAQWGTASYDFSSGETGLCYVTDTAAGIRVKLLLKYENNVLSEIILQTLSE